MILEVRGSQELWYILHEKYRGVRYLWSHVSVITGNTYFPFTLPQGRVYVPQARKWSQYRKWSPNWTANDPKTGNDSCKWCRKKSRMAWTGQLNCPERDILLQWLNFHRIYINNYELCSDWIIANHYVNSSPPNWKQYRFVSEETK